METDRPLLADLRQDIGGLGADLRELASQRWQLSRLEIQAGLESTKRLSIGAVAAVILGLTGVALLSVCVADLLEGVWGVSREGWLAMLGAALLAAAGLLGFSAWRRFRREFRGLEQTLEELREDVSWIEEWVNRAEDT
ncbi:MAG: phage holin family protein [Rhodopirellula sp.]|nr:phage holin family protein [Rhodopirellula sp.]